MQSFKEYVNTPKVYFSDHFDDRMAERVPETTKKEIHRMINDANNQTTHGDYLIFSKSLNFGVVVNRKKDRFVVITILPKGKQTAKTGTEKIVVESFYNKLSVEFLVYIEGLNCSDKVVNEDYSEKEIYDKNYRLNVVYIDDKFLECKQCGIVEVY